MSEATPSPHPSVDTLRTFGLGQLDPGEASVVEEHVSHCEVCCRTLSEVGPDTLVDLLRQARKLPALDHESGTVALTQASAEVIRERLSVRAEAALPGLPPELANHPRYRVLALLGAGGMGAVYKAEHRLMERPVALKVMAASLVGSPAMVERFRREVKAAARLSHPNIVTAHDAEQAGDLHLLIMEYVEGIDLARVVVENGPLPVAQACEYVRQAAAGLQHAHEHGMIHRDIKPHNLMLTPQVAPSDRPVFSPDGTQIVSIGGDGSIRLSEITTGKAVREMKSNADTQRVHILSGGRQLVSWGKDKTLFVWDAASGKEVRKLALGDDANTNTDSVAVSPDGRLVLIAHDNATVRVRELATGKELHRYQLAGLARSLTFSPDSRFVAAGSFRVGVYLWRLPAPPLEK